MTIFSYVNLNFRNSTAINISPLVSQKGFSMAQTVKNLPAMQDTRLRFLSQEDPLEKGMATHSSILAWRIPWTEEPGGLQSMVQRRVGHDGVTHTFTSLSTL